MSATTPVCRAAETVPIVHETSERIVRTIVFGVPPAALAVGGWLAWGGSLHWHDLLVLAITYTLSGFGSRSAFIGCSRIGASRPRAAFVRCWRCWARWRSRVP
jgi:hypothetical protein